MIRLYFILFERSVTILQLLGVSAKIQLCVHECVCVRGLKVIHIIRRPMRMT